MKIDPKWVKKGKNGELYLDAILIEKEDQYGNAGFICQDVPKDAREAGERGPIIGNWKHLGRTVLQQKPAPETRDEEGNFNW